MNNKARIALTLVLAGVGLGLFWSALNFDAPTFLWEFLINTMKSFGGSSLTILVCGTGILGILMVFAAGYLWFPKIKRWES